MRIGRTDVTSSVSDLEEALSDPPSYVDDALARTDGDIMVLGVNGKMGPTLARMARRALDRTGSGRQVIGVSRFTAEGDRESLERVGVRTIQRDLLSDASLASLPDVPNIIYMAGMKFGSSGRAGLTWAMNTYLPGRVCERFAKSRIVAFSTGNLYGLVPLSSGGSVETDALNPSGDYAMSCVGRERMFEHFSQSNGTPVTIIRLNYACELRYGVLVDLAQRVWAEQPIDLAMGHFNVIWQGDANAMSLAALALTSSPAAVLNVAGPETLSVRRVAQQLGDRMGKRVTFTGSEGNDALLNNAQKSHGLFGYPSVPVEQLIQWVADWIAADGVTLNKPTHFEARDGKY